MAKKSKKESLEEAVAEAVGAGRELHLPTVDFSDPNRPKTCLEVDFPILPINHVAAIEGNAGKPIYQMSKWWARRRSSVFRSMLIAAATKAPEDEQRASKVVWDAYYANHQTAGQSRGRVQKTRPCKGCDLWIKGLNIVVQIPLPEPAPFCLIPGQGIAYQPFVAHFMFRISGLGLRNLTADHAASQVRAGI